MMLHFFKNKAMDPRGQSLFLSRNLWLAGALLLAASGAIYKSFSYAGKKKKTPPYFNRSVVVSPATVELCKGGNSNTVNIEIVETNADDFEETSSTQTLVLELSKTGFSFDETVTPTVTITGSDVGTNPRFENGKLKIDYQFNTASTTNTALDKITITGVKVKASFVASENAEINATSGTNKLKNVDATTIWANVTLKNTPKAGTIVGPNVLYAGQEVIFFITSVADEYEWVIPSGLIPVGLTVTNGKTTTTDNFIKVMVDDVTSASTVSLQVKGKNTTTTCDGPYSLEYSLSLNPVGVVLTPATIKICKDNGAHGLPAIILSETIANDFQGAGTLVLSLADKVNFTLSETPVIEINNEIKPAFSATLDKNTQILSIDYDFDGFDTSLDTLKISGLKVSASDMASGSTQLTPTTPSGTSTPAPTSGIEGFTKLDNSSIFATIDTEDALGQIGPITGPGVIFSGETVNFSAPLVAGVSYEWDIPAELNGGTAEQKTTTTNTIPLTAESITPATELEVSLRVKTKKPGCSDGTFSEAHSISIQNPGLKVTPADITLCKGQGKKTLPAITLTEQKITDFKKGSGSGTLILALSNADFTLSGSPKVVVTNTSNTFNASVNTTNKTLELTYDFSNTTTQNNVMTITDLEIAANVSAPDGPIYLKPKTGTTIDFTGVTDTSTFATIHTVTLPGKAPSFTVSSNTLCVGTAQTFTINAITDADNYEWVVPFGVNFTPSGNGLSIDATATTDAVNGKIQVRGVSSIGCTGDWLEANVTIKKRPGKGGLISIIGSTSSELCAGGSAIFYVDAILPTPTDGYEWDLPAELNGGSAGTKTSSENFIPLTATTNINIETKVNIRVRGKNNGCTDGEYSDNYEVVIYPLPKPTITMTSNGNTIIDGADHPLNGKPVALSANLPKGTFSGKGVTGNQFYPNIAQIGKHDITYTYKNGKGCEGTTKVSINVVLPSEVDGLVNTYCRNDTKVYPFRVSKKVIKGSIISYTVGLKKIPEIAGGPTFKDRSEINCRQIINLNEPEGLYQYSFNPTLTNNPIVNITKFVLVARLHPIDSSILSCNIEERPLNKKPIEILAVPTVSIKPAKKACADNSTEYTYSITSVNADYEYEWSIPDKSGIMIPSNVSGEVKVRWQTASNAHRLHVTAKSKILNSCEGTAFRNVEVVAPPSAPTISGEFKDLCANSTKIYTTNAVANSYTWQVSNGSITAGQGTKTVEVRWLQANGSIELSIGNEANCKSRSFKNVTVNPSLNPTFIDASSSTTDINKFDVCAESTQLPYNATPSDNGSLTWKVTGGSIEGVSRPEADGSYIINGRTNIKVNWSGSGEGSITITETKNGCTGSLTQLVKINPLPSLRIEGPASNKICKSGKNVNFIGKDGSIPTTGDFTLTGGPMDTTAQASTTTYTIDPGQLEVGTYQLSYEYINKNSCYDSIGTSFEIIDAPKVAFTGIDPPNITKYCINADTIFLAPTVGGSLPSPASQGFFTISTGVEQKKLARGIHYLIPRLLAVGKHSISYTFTTSNGCKATTPAQDFEIVALPKLEITNILAGGYCVRNNNSVPLTVEINTSKPANAPVLSKDRIFFEVRRATRPQTQFENLTQTGKLSNVFNPSHPIPSEKALTAKATISEWNKLAGEYQVRYHYTDGEGCKNVSSPVTIVVNPLPVLSFTGLEAGIYCNNETNVVLKPLAGGQAITSSVKFMYRQKNTTKFKDFKDNNLFNPSKLTPGTYEIIMEYNDANGCTNISAAQTVSIVPTPNKVRITATKDYDKAFIKFDATAQDIGTKAQWTWDFKDGTTRNEQKPTIALNASSPSSINYSLTISNGTCDTVVNKSFKLDFDFKGQCAKRTTQFTNHSLPKGKQVTYLWDFGDGSATSSDSIPRHTYQNPGTYTITMSIATTDSIVTYTLHRRIDIFPVIKVNEQQFYTEGFEKSKGGWITHGIVNKVDSTSWKRKIPDGFLIKNPTGNAWITDNQDNPKRSNPNTNYNNNEASYVESPCFDIGGLSKPMISFNYWSDMDNTDGVVLLYTIDDGKTWHRLGKQDFGIDWYNTQSILGEPGQVEADSLNNNPGNQGWSGKSRATPNQWRLARYSLTEVLQKMDQAQVKNRMVRFRMSFGSNSDNPLDKKFDGFAFDNFTISNRNRIVLLEYFTNAAVANAETEDLKVKNFPETNSKNKEVISIHHHTDFPGGDLLNQQNEKDPSARAFYHGIREVPRAVVDGYFNDTLIAPWTTDYFSDRILISAPFAINVGQPTVSGNILNISASVTALQAFEHPVIMHVVLIDSVAKADNKTFYNVVRKMLPDAAGTYKGTPWALGDTQTLDFSWDIGDLDPQSFQVVVFVEDYASKEVHQAAVNKVKNNRTDEGQAGHLVTGTSPDLPTTDGILFPNPTTKTIQVKLATTSRLPSGTTWEILSVQGKIVKQGEWSGQKRSMKMDVSRLADGFYIFRMLHEGKSLQLRFEKK